MKVEKASVATQKIIYPMIFQYKSETSDILLVNFRKWKSFSESTTKQSIYIKYQLCYNMIELGVANTK